MTGTIYCPDRLSWVHWLHLGLSRCQEIKGHFYDILRDMGDSHPVHWFIRHWWLRTLCYGLDRQFIKPVVTAILFYDDYGYGAIFHNGGLDASGTSRTTPSLCKVGKNGKANCFVPSQRITYILKNDSLKLKWDPRSDHGDIIYLNNVSPFIHDITVTFTLLRLRWHVHIYCERTKLCYANNYALEKDILSSSFQPVKIKIL